MSSTISVQKQRDLCALLNLHYGLPGLTWFPDNSPLQGGIVARDATGSPWWEVIRDDGRVRVRLPFRRRENHHDQGTPVGERGQFEGRNWLEPFAVALFEYLKTQDLPEIPTKE